MYSPLCIKGVLGSPLAVLSLAAASYGQDTAVLPDHSIIPEFPLSLRTVWTITETISLIFLIIHLDIYKIRIILLLFVRSDRNLCKRQKV